MMRIKSSYRIFLMGFIAIIVSLGSCSDNPTTPSGPTISSNTPVVLESQSIGSGGGNVVYQSVSDSLSGLTITVPIGAVSTSTTFVVSAATITKSSFRSDMRLLTPLLSISSGGALLSEPVTITIPVRVPARHFAMAFLYDEKTSKLEALPLVGGDSTKVQILMTNFRNSKTAGIQAVTEDEHSSLVVVSTEAELLNGVFDSQFEMGVDNCQFINYGSHIAPGGHCGGQSIAVAWYYTAKKKHGSPGLYGLFDNDGIQRTPQIWQDDEALYRFCSVLQRKSHWVGMKYFGDKSTDRDVRIYKSIALAIRETGCPQPLYVYDGDKIAHAILATKAANGVLTVADPNYFEFRTITLDKRLGDFVPYNLSRYVGDTQYNCMDIYQASLSQIIDFEECAQLWNTVLDGTIGVEMFPKVRVKILDRDGNYVEPAPGASTKVYQLTSIDVGSGLFNPDFRIYDFDTKEVLSDDVRDIHLSVGKHKIGVSYSKATTFPFSGYIGFRWLDVDVGVGTEGPQDGALQLNLSVDGMKPKVIESSFQVVGNSDKGYGLSIYASVLNSNGGTDLLSLSAAGWNGGLFDGDLNPISKWEVWVSSTEQTLYKIVVPNFGNMKITDWSPGKLAGSFSCTVYTADKAKSVALSGTFSYP